MSPQNYQSELRSKITKYLDSVVGFRHERHQFPELTWQEKETSKALLQVLNAVPQLKIREGVGVHGILAELDGTQPGPTVALRADMDALPIKEQNQVPYKSKVDGAMHACGHDGHMANLYGVVQVLSEMQSHIKGKIRFIFQPAEEGGAGAAAMIKDGALEGVDVIFGLHAWPELACGHLGFRQGPLLASTSELNIAIEGRGGHAAMPHLCTDQVLIAARVIEALQILRSRFVHPAEPFVLSITECHAGNTHNVIPATAKLRGTVRTVSRETHDRVEHAVHEICQSIGQSYGVEVKASLTPQYPVTFNHSEPTSYLVDLGRSLFEKEQIHELAYPSLGAEDFAFYLEKIPGSYFFLGMDDRQGAYPSLHHPKFDFNDKALAVGMEMLASAALSWGHRS